ncbi:MAG: prepilin-type N-terminal cleavage/methylation domain-containing protein [Lentisphaerae bacterium]|nr:prepilin-type N-terminal cleavage/methylation domain-containing protein [Lentisphaerota bacterium]
MNTAPSKGGDRPAGFSLIEIMLVVAIMAFAALLTVPSVIKRVPYYRLDGAVSSVLAELRAARMAAVSENQPVEVSLDAPNRLLVVLIDRNENDVYESDETVTLKIAESEKVSVSVSVTNGTFTPRGDFQCDEGLWKITVVSQGAGEKFVYVFQSGQVQESDESL